MIKSTLIVAISSLALLLPVSGKVTKEPKYSYSFQERQPLSIGIADSPELELEPLPYAPAGTYANDYVWGNCTALVASMVKVPNSMGNANAWASVASRKGYTVSSVPVVGAVAQTGEGWAGHVAVVIAVHGNKVTVEEQNYKGLGVIDERTTDVKDWVYIYF